jgi:uncharacterized protein (DUF2062 family)
MFQRRQKHGWAERLRRLLWPRSGWLRALRYRWIRLKRLPATPDQIARGFAIGAAVAVTPFVGLHMWLAFALAWLTKGSLVASFAGTFLGNYVTMVPLLLLDYQIGNRLLHLIGVPPAPLNGHVTFAHLIEHPSEFAVALWEHPVQSLPLIWPTLLGSFLLAVFVYAVVVVIVADAVRKWRRHRSHALQARRLSRHHKHAHKAST